ncbi:hypothetical protein I3760_13G055100 [Carya illinoinensis]|nr:hypothetical protein I3760_13G055100 [Carya illinoinensis]
MEKDTSAYRAHCLVFAYPGQGHINPMVEFSKHLKHKGVEVTLVTTHFICKNAQKEVGSIVLETISNGYDEGMTGQIENIQTYLERFERIGSKSLTELLEKLSRLGRPVNCIVYYPFMPWALNIAMDWMSKIMPMRTVGPTIPSMFLDKQLEDDNDYGFIIFKPNTDACVEWLNDRMKGSIVYVSVGSMTVLEVEQMQELAWSLRMSNNYFLWVVRASEEAKLPKNFVEETLEKGLVVQWCRQLEVLAYEAVGCFVTHCNWNSTLKAVSFGIPMVALPQWTDQSTDAKYIVDI